LYEKSHGGNNSLEVIFMVKGTSRQVLVLNSPEQKLFEQVIFILKDDAVGKEGITDRQLLQEANNAVNQYSSCRKKKINLQGLVWGCAGAIVTGIVWYLSGLM